MNKTEKNLIQHSEDAEVRYYKGGAFAVDNYDTECEFEEEASFHAVVKRDKKGNLLGTPFCQAGTGRGPRSVTICDTGVAKATKSPKGNNIRVVVVLSRDCATERNFRNHFNNLFELIKDKDINLKEV